MSYILEAEAPAHSVWPRRLAIACAVLVAVLACYLAGRDGTAASAAAPAASVTWSSTGPWPVPMSASHGPFHTANGVASGFSHDELGAVLAAYNISYRLTPDVAPAVAASTVAQMTSGDRDTMLAQMRTEPTGTQIAPTELYYKVLAGDPTGGSVLLSIAVRSPDSAASGGYLAGQRSLTWRDGDWRMAVPLIPVQVMPSLIDYQFLGRPHV
jgi:hypothetical protein